jgi:uncharacterized phage protein (TIGR02216 family)
VSAFPWDEAAQFAFGRLKLSPREFWRTTPKELAMASNAMSRRTQPIKPEDFQSLMKAFPDKEGADGK